MRENGLSVQEYLIELQSVADYFNAAPTNHIMDKDTLQRWLAQNLEELSLNDLQKFFQLLYRLDIDESRVKDIMQNESLPFMQLAETILQRQAKKKYWRERFRSSHDMKSEGDEESW